MALGLTAILEWFPQAEVFARSLYWRSKFVHGLIRRRKRGARSGPPVPTGSPSIGLDALGQELHGLGVARGDILIVHSAMKSLAATGAGPQQLLDFLLDLIGPSGTLVMPAIALYPEAPTDISRLTADLSDTVWLYDVRKTRCWTGMLPTMLMKRPGARRSRYPLNSIVALGPEADAMMARELDRSGGTPCGPDSAWAYCAQRNAKIVALGVDLVHSLTMIHVAEDCHEDSWPVANWYRDRKFHVRDGEFDQVVTVRERHPKWAIHYAERRFARDLERSGAAQVSNVGHISIRYVEAAKLMDFLDKRKRSGYPYVLWRWPL